MTIDQRKHERSTIPVSVRLIHPDIGTIELKIKDMSYGGLFLLIDTPDFLPIGSKVKIQVITRGVDTPITKMKIVRMTSKGIGLCYC